MADRKTFSWRRILSTVEDNSASRNSGHWLSVRIVLGAEATTTAGVREGVTLARAVKRSVYWVTTWDRSHAFVKEPADRDVSNPKTRFSRAMNTSSNSANSASLFAIHSRRMAFTVSWEGVLKATCCCAGDWWLAITCSKEERRTAVEA